MDTTKLSTLATALLREAKNVQKNAYAPYSNFNVGVALHDEHADLHVGCNVENAAYPLGQCAEATAIGTMVASGGKQIKQLLIVSPNKDFCYPCGGCRQKIAEFATPTTVITLVNGANEVIETTIDNLLPNTFRID